MKILIYGLNYHPELIGIGKYTGEMAEWLARRGHEIRVVTAPPYYPEWKIKNNYSYLRYQKENLNGVTIFRCPIYIPRKLNGLTRILHLLSFSFSSFFILIYLASWRPHILINVIPTFFSTIGSLFCSLLYKSKSWLHIQDYELDTAYNLGMLKLSRLRNLAESVENSIFKKFDRISTISPPMLRKIYQKGIHAKAVCLFPNWVDTYTIFPLRCFNSIREKLGFSQDDIVALYAGNMGAKQGLEILVNIARELASQKNIRFVFCGEGPVKAKLISLSSELPNIVFLPLQPQSELNLLLNLADIHLLPQKPEAADLVMPSKLSGIFASGKPVIAITDPDTEIGNSVKGRGVTVGSDNFQAIKNAILWLAENPNQREKFGMAGRAYAVEHLDKNIILNQFENCLREFVNTNNNHKKLGTC